MTCVNNYFNCISDCFENIRRQATAIPHFDDLCVTFDFRYLRPNLRVAIVVIRRFLDVVGDVQFGRNIAGRNDRVPAEIGSATQHATWVHRSFDCRIAFSYSRVSCKLLL